MSATCRFCLTALYWLMPFCLLAQSTPALIPYRIGALWGYADSNGTIVVPPQFDEAYPFVRQLEMLSPYFNPEHFQPRWPEVRQPVALVKKDSLWGLLDAHGKVLVPAVGRERLTFAQAGKDVFWVRYDAGERTPHHDHVLKTALLSLDGTLLTPFIYDHSSYDDDGDGWGEGDTYGHSSFGWSHQVVAEYLAVCKGERWGMISVHGEEIIPPVWGSITPGANGVAITYSYDSLTLEGYSGEGRYLVGLGNRIIRKLDSSIENEYYSRQGLFVVQRKGLVGFMNVEGEMAIPFSYTECYGFTDDGLAKVRTADGRWLIIDTKGQTVFALGPNGGCWKHPEGYFVQEDDGLWHVYDQQFRKIGGDGFDFPPQKIEVCGQAYYSGQRRGFSGLMYPDGNVALPFEYEAGSSFERAYFNGQWNQDAFYVQKNGKHCLLDCDFREIIPCGYGFMSQHIAPGLFMLQDGNKYGIYNATKRQWVLPAVFDGIEFRSQNVEPYFIVQQGRYWGKYDTEGRELFPAIFENNFFESSSPYPLLVKSQRGWHVFDKNLREIANFDPAFDGSAYISEFNNPGQKFMAIRAQLNGKPALFDLQGKQLVPPDFDFFQLHHDLIFAKKGGKEGVLTYPGLREVIPFEYKNIGYDNGKFRLYELDGKGFVLYDPATGKHTKINFPYSSIYGFSEGLALVHTNCIFGFVDENFKEVVPTQFTQAHSFSEGLAAVKTSEGKWGYLNTKGEFALMPQYLRAESFEHGLAKVEFQRLPDSTKWQALIDHDGHEVYSVRVGEGAYINRSEPFYIIAESQTNYTVLDYNQRVVLSNCSCVNNNSGRGIQYICNGQAGVLLFDGSKQPAADLFERLKWPGGLTSVQYCQAWGLQDSTGRWVIPLAAQYGDTQDGGKTFQIWRNGNVGLFDRSGLLLIPAEYEQIYPLGDYWQVTQKGLLGLFDQQGRMVVPAAYSQVEPLLLLGLVKVTTPDRKVGFYDFKGRKYFAE